MTITYEFDDTAFVYLTENVRSQIRWGGKGNAMYPFLVRRNFVFPVVRELALGKSGLAFFQSTRPRVL